MPLASLFILIASLKLTKGCDSARLAQAARDTVSARSSTIALQHWEGEYHTQQEARNAAQKFDTSFRTQGPDRR
jgi:hypothetical protein